MIFEFNKFKRNFRNSRWEVCYLKNPVKIWTFLHNKQLTTWPESNKLHEPHRKNKHTLYRKRLGRLTKVIPWMPFSSLHPFTFGKLLQNKYFLFFSRHCLEVSTPFSVWVVGFQKEKKKKKLSKVLKFYNFGSILRTIL